MMDVVELDGRTLIGWTSFHTSFARAFGFPSWYGRNQDAWIDVMEEALSERLLSQRLLTQPAARPGPLVLQITWWPELRDAGPDQATALVSLVAALNARSQEAGGPLLLALAPVEGA